MFLTNLHFKIQTNDSFQKFNLNQNTTLPESKEWMLTDPDFSSGEITDVILWKSLLQMQVA